MTESLITAVQSAAEPVSWVLLHSLWVGGVIAIILAVTSNLLKAKSPQFRYALAGLAMILVLPVSVSLVVYDSVGPELAMSLEAGENNVTESAVSLETSASQQTAPTVWTRLTDFHIASQEKAAPWIFLAWILGIASISAYHLAGWRHARSLLRLSSHPVPEEWQQRFQYLCHRIGVSRTVQVMASSLVKMPCVVGWIKPTILLPVSIFSGLSTEDIDMILAHELAHVHRHDVLMNYAQTAVETVLFFNPAVWWISRQIRAERENCCDDLAVAIMGDRVAYARALTNLEDLRSVRPHLAPAADGASLMKRVGRLMGKRSSNSRWPGFRAVTVLTMAAILSISFSLFAALAPVEAADNDNQQVVTYQEQDDDLHGYFDIEPDREGVSLRMSFSRRSRSSFGIDPVELIGFGEGNDVQFKLVRDAGTFFFVGDIEKDGIDYFGEGDCHFRADPDYVEQMRDMGYRIRSERESFTLALHDITLEFARGIEAAGYGRMSLDKLIELHIHQVTPKFISDLEELGYRNLRLNRLVEMRIHRAIPDYIRELQKHGYTDIDPGKLVEMRIHGVDPDYVEELARLGYNDISPSKLVEMKIHGVSTYYIEDLQELGFKNLRPGKLVEMSIHDVEVGYVKDLIKLGLDDLTPSDLVSMSIHNVSIGFIEDLIDRGYDDLSADELVEFKIHGFDRKRSRRETSY